MNPFLDPALAARVLHRDEKDRDAKDREDAFTEIVRALQAPLFALAFNIVRDRAEAEDAVQETFLAVHRALPNFRGEAKLSTWIWRIAIRSALAARAKRKPSQELNESLVAPDAGDPAEQQQERARLQKAFDALSAEQRVVLSLFAVDGLSHKDIAEMLGVPEGTVWSRLHAAKKRLQSALGSHFSPGGP